MPSKKMTVAEETFLIVRELNAAGATVVRRGKRVKVTTSFFRWKDWLRAWRCISPRPSWGGSDMSVAGALKQQCWNGTVQQIGMGLYCIDRNDDGSWPTASAPFSLFRNRKKR